MPWIPAIANALWTAANLPDYARFRRALPRPALTQEALLRKYWRQNASTSFGREHDFAGIGSYQDFVRHVPMRDYDALEPWMARVHRGEPDVLFRGRATRLVPTSGTSSARKLIPFTAGLQQEFNSGLAPWLADLARHTPAILGGPAYWSITPMTESDDPNASATGFDSDAAYLGGARARLVESILAVPAAVQHAGSIDAFRYATLLCLLRCRELRLISVWHPSFLSLLLDRLPGHWTDLLEDIARGTCACASSFPKDSPFRRRLKPLPERVRQLRAEDPLRPQNLWPRLAVISCWADGPAAFGVADLQRRFPGVFLQPKGLLATEGFVTLPFGACRPLALTSHFFEFLDDDGRVRLAEELSIGGEYEIVITTGGGLWRYRLGDRVRVDGLVARTPSLTFLGRVGNVSDQFGEKLSETFVAEILGDVLRESSPPFALLAPDEDADGWRYTLFLEGDSAAELAERLDRALSRNPQYAWCRKLGQLLPARVFLISGGGYESFVQYQAAQGARLGDIKPALLSKSAGWSNRFAGRYLVDAAERVSWANE
jgi:hypothetical protein